MVDIVITVKYGKISEIGSLHAPERLPIGIPYINNRVDRNALNDWWIGRSIPASRSGMRDALAYHQHYLNCCNALGIPEVIKSIDQMLTVDYIIVNDDRHFNNFGAVRYANTLSWIGVAPIFDCGTSMWRNEPTPLIRNMAKHPSKPFKSKHSEQIKLVFSFKWLEMKTLYGIDEELREMLTGALSIDEPRRDALCYGLRKRVEQLGTYIKSKDL